MSERQVYTVFDRTTRRAVGRVICAPGLLNMHTQGQIAIPGHYDTRTTILNDANEPVDDLERRAARDAEHADTAARAALEEIDRRKIRAIGELLLDANNSTARAKLQELEAAAAAERSKLTRAGGTETS